LRGTIFLLRRVSQYYIMILGGKNMKKIINILLVVALLVPVFTFAPKASATAKPFDWELINQSPYPSTLNPGENIEVWVEVKNTGTVTWNRDGIINVVRLGSGSKYGSVNQQRDYNSEFYDDRLIVTDCISSVSTSCIGENTPIPMWLSKNRPTKIMHPVVRPGWHTRFQFTIRAPETPGTYKAYFTPVVEGVEWMKDIGLYWQITVDNSNNPCEGDAPGCANPASVKCTQDGGTLQIITQTDRSQYGVCKFPSGKTCEEWDYFRNGSACVDRPVVTVSSLILSPNTATIKSGNVYDFILVANYSDGTTSTVTNSATWDVVYGTGTGTMHRDIPGRFIAGGLGTCNITASFGGKSVTSGAITVTGL